MRRRTPEPAHRAYPGLVNSGVDGILSALELMGSTEVQLSGKRMKEGAHDAGNDLRRRIK
jgi:hypothetical protein